MGFGFSRMDCIRIGSNIWGEKTKIVWNLNSFEIMIATDLFINGWRLTSLQIFDKNSLRWIVDLYRTWMKYEIGSTLIKNMFGTHTKRDRIIIGFIVAKQFRWTNDSIKWKSFMIRIPGLMFWVVRITSRPSQFFQLNFHYTTHWFLTHWWVG